MVCYIALQTPNMQWSKTVVILYGIKNCDTVKKARKWLDSRSIDYQFHDFRADGLSPESVQAWLDELGWETLVNKRSTSWKQLDPAARDTMGTIEAKAAILEQPTLIKRPLMDTGHSVSVGFSEVSFEKKFTQHTL